MVAAIVGFVVATLIMVQVSFIARRRERRVYGPRIAHDNVRLRFRLLALGIGYGILLVIARRAGIHWLPLVRGVGFFGVALAQSILFLSWRARRADAGELLLDLDRFQDWRVRAGSGIVLLGLGAALLIGSYVAGAGTWSDAAFAALLLSFGAGMIASGLSHLELREDGVLRFPRVYPWDDIVAFRFERGGRNILSLELEHTIWSFEKELHLPCSPESEPEVSRLLELNGVVAHETTTTAERLATKSDVAVAGVSPDLKR